MSFRVCNDCYYIYRFAADGLSSSTCSQNINVGPWESCWFARHYAGVWHCVILASLTEKCAKKNESIEPRRSKQRVLAFGLSGWCVSDQSSRTVSHPVRIGKDLHSFGSLELEGLLQLSYCNLSYCNSSNRTPWGATLPNVDGDKMLWVLFGLATTPLIHPGI